MRGRLRTCDVSTSTAALIDRSTRLDLDGIDFDRFRSEPLDPDSLRCLRYMHDVEHHTSCYLRDLLVTRAHRDPEVTAFLTCWAYEELWHGEAIGRVLAAHHEVSGIPRVAALRRHLPVRDQFRPVLFSVGSTLSPHVVAVHAAWGAVNEWTTQAGYSRLGRRAGHPVLSELLCRIMRQEGRHVSFYAATAQHHLAAARSARRLVRHALDHWWAPVGSSLMPPAEVAFLSRHLFGGRDGLDAVRRVDRQVDRLPGLSGLHLLERAVAGAPDRRPAHPLTSGDP